MDVRYTFEFLFFNKIKFQSFFYLLNSNKKPRNFSRLSKHVGTITTVPSNHFLFRHRVSKLNVKINTSTISKNTCDKYFINVFEGINNKVIFVLIFFYHCLRRKKKKTTIDFSLNYCLLTSIYTS